MFTIIFYYSYLTFLYITFPSSLKMFCPQGKDITFKNSSKSFIKIIVFCHHLVAFCGPIQEILTPQASND
jgi:hypothetical protein